MKLKKPIVPSVPIVREKKLCVDDTEPGPALIPFVLVGFVNRFPVFSSTSGIFEFCRATFVVFYFYNARRL